MIEPKEQTLDLFPYDLATLSFQNLKLQTSIISNLRQNQLLAKTESTLITYILFL